MRIRSLLSHPVDRDRRRRQVAGIMSLLGWVPACAGARPPPGSIESERQLLAVWEEATRIVQRERGDYPFDQSGQKRISDALSQQAAEVREWVKVGRLRPAEGALLIQELTDLRRRVGDFRPVEFKEATCYEPQLFGPGESSPEQLEARLPVLAKVADDEVLRPHVLRKVIIGFERDLDRLERRAEGLEFRGMHVAEFVRRAKEQIARLKARLADQPHP